MKTSVKLAIEHELCEEDIRTLQEAKKILQRDQIKFVCHAITRIYQLQGNFRGQVTRLHNYILDLLTPYSIVPLWLRAHYPDVDNVNLTEYRLQWIDHMIADIEEAIAIRAQQSQKQQERSHVPSIRLSIS